MSRAAARTFSKLSQDDRSSIRKALHELAINIGRPGWRGAKATKTLRGTSDEFHRLRVGDHRVMYDALDSDRVILVLGIVDREDLERWLRRR